MNIIHIGYGDSAAGCLRAAIKLGMPGDKVVVSRDDFTQGPISDSIDDGGLSQRSQYWSALKTLLSNRDDVYGHYASSIKGIDSIERNSKVILWIGDSAHDQMASSWIITYLKDKNIDWQYIDLKEVNLAMLTHEQVRTEYEGIIPLSTKLQEEYETLWNRLAIENAQYRIQTNSEILSVNEEYHDEFILSQLTKKDLLLGKLMRVIMSHSEHRLTDTTIESRLVALQAQKKIKIELSLVSVFMSKVKLK